MKKLTFMMAAAGLLATSALTSCKKEEVKSASPTQATQATPSKNLNKSSYFYRKWGLLHEVANDWFCTYHETAVCYYIIVGKKKTLSESSYLFTPEDGETSFEVVKYRQTGPVSEFYTEVTETTDANGNPYCTGIKANPL